MPRTKTSRPQAAQPGEMTMVSLTCPEGMTGLSVEPWAKGEIYAVAADWAQASAPVLTYGEDEWVLDSRGRQVADFRHNSQAALEAIIREAAIASGDALTDDETETILAEAEEIGE